MSVKKTFEEYGEKFNLTKSSYENLYLQAYEDIQKSIYIKKDTESSWTNKGIICNNLKMHEEDIESYSNALNINPNNDIVYGYRVKIYQDMGKTELSKKDYKKALELNESV